MGDSDEEFDNRRGREKFQRERPADVERERRGGGGGRDNWNENDRNRTRSDGQWGRGRKEYHDNRRQRDRYSNSPPQKRMRRDWDDREAGGYGGGGGHDRGYGGGGGGFGGPPMGGSGGGWGGGDLRQHIPPAAHPGNFGGGPPMNRPQAPEPEFPCQPPLIPFKQFLATQDDTISEEEAVARYNQYKLDFKKTQLNEYFLAHKEEEWFRLKYHPEESTKRTAELKANIQNRLQAFKTLLYMGKINSTPIDISQVEPIILLLDSAVTLMEGGNEEDLNELEKQSEKHSVNPEAAAANPGQVGNSAPIKEKEMSPAPTPKSPTSKKSKKKKAKKEAKKAKRQKRQRGGDSDDEGSASDSSSSSNSSSSSSSSSSSDTESDVEEGEQKDDKPRDSVNRNISRDDGNVGDSSSKGLHRTQSIFLRNLAPNITKQEVEAVCTKYPGYMRVALQDPQPERNFFRRGWATFNKSVVIKDICWNLNNNRLRDCELKAIVNRDLRQRVRPVSGLVNHKQAIKTYIKLAAKVIQNLDHRWNVWINEKDDEKKDEEKEMSFGLVSPNPVLKGITDYLVDEASLEDELLGGAGDEAPGGQKDPRAELAIEKDEKMIKVLDRMVWYLRIVFSIDFYNGIEYPNEHEMPHRCGIIHARGVIPEKLPTQTEMNDFVNHFETKVKQFTDEKRKLDDSECVKLGKKDIESEVEKFINANTQEIGKDKWLCPLSGKKFKGPEFVRKHIMSKHMEKIDEVKVEAKFFNNYLEDAKRPQLPEHPSNTSRANNRRSMHQPDMGHPQGPPGYGGPGGQMMGPPGGFRGGFRGDFQPYGGGGGRSGGYGGRHDPYNNREPFRPPPRDNRDGRYGGGGRYEGRRIIQYTDLDAPGDDIF